MKLLRVFGCVVLVAVLASCATSYVMVGKKHPPTNPENVRLLLKAPVNYETIALLDTSDRGAFCFTSQCRTDKVVERLKDKAAKLGANAILFEGTSDGTAGSVGTGTFYGSTGVGFGSAIPIKHGKAIAIFVKE